MKKPLIIGSTGLVGSYLLKEILNEPNLIQVTALVRKKGQIQNTKLNEIQFD